MSGKRRKRRKRQGQMLPIIIVIIALFFVVALKGVQLKNKNDDYKSKLAELNTELKEEKKRTKEIEEYKAYVLTDDFIKKIAREKLNLVDKNEIIFYSSKN